MSRELALGCLIIHKNGEHGRDGVLGEPLSWILTLEREVVVVGDPCSDPD